MTVIPYIKDQVSGEAEAFNPPLLKGFSCLYLVIVENDEAKECHEDKDLDDHEEVVLVGHTPDDAPLLLAHPDHDIYHFSQRLLDSDLPSATASLTAHPATIASRDMKRVREPAARQNADIIMNRGLCEH